MDIDSGDMFRFYKEGDDNSFKMSVLDFNARG